MHMRTSQHSLSASVLFIRKDQNADIIQFSLFSVSLGGIVSYFVDTILWKEARTDYGLMVFPAPTVTITDRRTLNSQLLYRGVVTETYDCVWDNC